MSDYYILLGGAEHLAFFEHHARFTKEQWFWTVPMTACVGETAFVYMAAPVSRLVGQVKIVGEPFFNVEMFQNPKTKNRWMGEIGEVRYLEARPELTIKGLRALFPDWGWLRYPRNKTKIPADILKPFLELVEAVSR